MNPLLKVIDDYKKDVAYGIKLFHKKYGKVNLIREWRKTIFHKLVNLVIQ